MTDPFFESRPEHMPLGKLVSWVGGAVQSHYRRTVAHHGVSGTEVSALGVLAHADGPLSQRELAGRVGLTPATLTPVLDSLDRDGRIHRERDGTDRRVVRVSVTEEGRAHLRSVFTDVAAAFRERMPRPSDEDAAVIRRYLVAVLEAVSDDDRYVPGGPTAGAEGGREGAGR